MSYSTLMLSQCVCVCESPGSLWWRTTFAFALTAAQHQLIHAHTESSVPCSVCVFVNTLPLIAVCLVLCTRGRARRAVRKDR